MYEFAQIFVSKALYLADPWNYIDLIRGTLCMFWIVYYDEAAKSGSALTLSVVMLCFLRGFTYFRSFQMTRIFVHMTMEVVKDVYSFLVILGYSVFSFGIFASIIQVNEPGTLAEAWTSAFNMAMGGFDSSNFNRLQWAVFMTAGIVNVVIMMNLLVSILGEAYEKTQMSIVESDLLEQLSLLLEYEHLLFWRRKAGHPTFLVVCKEAKDVGDSDEWSGKVLQITSTLQKDNKRIEGKMTLVSDEIKQKFERMGEKLASNYAGVKEMVSGMQEKSDTHAEMTEANIANIDSKLTEVAQNALKVEGMVLALQEKFDTRQAQVDQKLDAILALLQSRS